MDNESPPNSGAWALEVMNECQGIPTFTGNAMLPPTLPELPPHLCSNMNLF